MKWTKHQVGEARRIVNDISEGINNGESEVALRQALAIYADLLEDSLQKRSTVASEKTLAMLEKAFPSA